jgi:hypothetical protein
MRKFFEVLSILVVLIPVHSCFGPFNPDDPGMGILPGDDKDTSGTTPKTPATMVAYWKCDDSTNFINSASYKALKSEVQEAVSFDTGVGGTGLSLSFTKDAYVNVFNDSALNFKDDSFTVSLWCKPAIANDPAILISKGTQDSSRSSFILELSGNYPAVRIMGETQKISDTLQLGIWNHIVFTRASGAMSLFLNSKRYSIGSENPIINNDKPLRIGAGCESSSFYRGNIDEIKIERKAWSENEVTSEYRKFHK